MCKEETFRDISSNNYIIFVGEFRRKREIASVISVLHSLEFTETASTKKQAILQRHTELYRFVLERLGHFP